MSERQVNLDRQADIGRAVQQGGQQSPLVDGAPPTAGGWGGRFDDPSARSAAASFGSGRPSEPGNTTPPPSPFAFTPPPPPVASDKRGPDYRPLNGHELGHMLYVKATAALTANHLFQDGLVYKDATFDIGLYVQTEAGEYQRQIASLDVGNRTGSQVLGKLLPRLATALASHHLFVEGVVYPLVTATLALAVDTGEASVPMLLADVTISATDAPDIIRETYGIPVPATAPSAADPAALDEEERYEQEQAEAPTAIRVGDVIRHDDYAKGAPLTVERIDDEGYHVRTSGSANLRKIGANSKVYKEAVVVERAKSAGDEDV